VLAALLVVPLIAANITAGAAQARTAGVRRAAVQPAAATSSLKRFYNQKIEWTACASFPTVKCTYVWVPLDYAKPAGTSIRLRVAMRPASDPRLKRGALFVNNGGPGGWGTSDAFHATQLYSTSVTDHYDVVGFDPRGIGGSSRLDCFTTPQFDKAFGFGPTGVNQTPTTAPDKLALNNAMAALGADCATKMPRLIKHVGTREGARDLDIMRALLRQKKLNYMAISYGTYLGAWYAQLFPKNVGRFVLDGAIDPSVSTQSLYVDQILAQESALHRFLADCPKHANCPKQLQGSAAANLAAFRALSGKLASSPSGVSGLQPLTQSRFLWAVQSRLFRDEDGWSLLRVELGALWNKNDARALDEVAYGWLGKSVTTGQVDAGLAAGTGIWCYDWKAAPDLANPANMTIAKLAQTAPDFGAVDMWSQQMCVKWPVHTTAFAHTLRAVGSPAILVVGNRYDPATPYRWAVSLSKQLQHGRLLTWDGDGHTGYHRGSSCIDSAIDLYLFSGVMPKVGTVCAAVPRV
jgi:pimeloyl-ACP methyl ester carboxylesterase